MDFEAVIESLLQPIADELGVEILKVSLGSGGRSKKLRVVVDRAGGIDSTGLERISRGLALQLDAEDLINGAFHLEVTSPGLDWPLQNEADFKRYQGEWLKVFFMDGSNQEGRNLGPAEAESGVCFLLQIEARKSRDNHQQMIDMDEVSKVVRAINWKEVSRKGKTVDSE